MPLASAVQANDGWIGGCSQSEGRRYGTLAFSCSLGTVRNLRRQKCELVCKRVASEMMGQDFLRHECSFYAGLKRTKPRPTLSFEQLCASPTLERRPKRLIFTKVGNPSRNLVMKADEGDADSRTRWIVLAGCDVCLPKDALPGSIYERHPRNTVAVPGVIHFIGGFLLGQFPRTAYGPFLESLVERTQMAVIATPFHSPAVVSANPSSSGYPVSPVAASPVLDTTLFFDHAQLARKLHERFRDASSALARLLASPERLPIYGMGHSLGAKLLALMCAEAPTDHATGKKAVVRPPRANIFLAYNNYSTRQSIPLFEEAMRAVDAVSGSTGWRLVESFLRDTMALGGVAKSDGSRSRRGPFRDPEPSKLSDTASAPGASDIWSEWAAMATGAARALSEREFLPSPEETQQRIELYYSCESNLIVKFAEDPIDQSDILAAALWYRFPNHENAFVFRQLPGGHLVPVSASYRRLFPIDIDAAGSTRGTSGSAQRSAPGSRIRNSLGIRSNPRKERELDQVDVLIETVSSYLRNC